MEKYISWFSGVQDEATFQTNISRKWCEILISLFHVVKILYFKLHQALVSCQYLYLSNHGSCEIKCPKIRVLLLSEIGQFSFRKNA